ncbi:MAG TPA: response regulator transcription factor [Thermoanaerobaculia bacterium]|nr:response regulator transcription factor [Thermoanaerobaculia bacterium]
MRASLSAKDPSRDQRLRGPARALLVVDPRVLTDVVRVAFHHAHCIIRVASTGREASTAAADWSPHLVVLDLDIGDDGMLKRFAAGFPVIALTPRSDLASRLAAFAQGADDVLIVPFSPEELAARVVAVLRRTYRDAAVFTPLLRLGDLEIDIQHRRVRAGGTDLHLTSLEQSLLYLLAANAGRLLTRDEILDDLWGADYVANSNIVDRHIRNLRVKLHDQSRHPRYIVTVPGRGYRFLVA